MASDYLILTTASHVNCQHGGRFTHIPTNFTCLIEGSPIWLHGDPFIINCPLGSAEGCSQIRWQPDTTGWVIDGRAIVTTSSNGELFNSKGIYLGRPFLVSCQTKVTLPQLIEAMKKANKK